MRASFDIHPGLKIRDSCGHETYSEPPPGIWVVLGSLIRANFTPTSPSIHRVVPRQLSYDECTKVP